MPYVALDLETTGLDPETDEIIEVAAIRFDAGGVIETYQTLVNPGRDLEYRIALLTGISRDDLARAPYFTSVSAEVEAFLGLDPIVGQNPLFDTTFLSRSGVQVFGPTFDTFELAGLLLPDLRQHSLGDIADHLGIEFPRRHRALADAEAAMRVFLALRARLAEQHPNLLAEAERIAAQSDWPLRHLLREVATEHPRLPGEEPPGLIHGFVRAPSPLPAALSPAPRRVATKPDEPVRALTSRAARAAIESFEERHEQTEMARAVAEAASEGGTLLVEAGTGVGKSLAYLVPSALHAVRNGTRVVVSTNTINLQEQLTGQDIPIARKLLAAAGIDEQELRVSQMKGRRNYLCLLRWAAARRAGSLTSDEARMLVRLLFWLGQTDTGDRAELSMRREDEAAWWRFSAQDGGCLSSGCVYVRDGSCFLYRARKRAEGAHVLVVNHALLLSDIATGGGVLPEYHHAVIDEAHHLEDEATSQFGFSASESDLLDWLERVYTRAGRDRESGFVAMVLAAARGEQQALSAGPQLQVLARTLGRSTDPAKERLRHFFRVLQEFAVEHIVGPNDYDQRMPINRGVRVQPAWSDVETAWFDAEESLAQVEGCIDELLSSLAQANPADILDRDALAAEASDLFETGERLRQGITRIIAEDDRETVCWLTMSRREASPSLSSAPLSVADRLRSTLFDVKESTVLTSATLTTEGNFDYIRSRLGAEDAREVMLGSPFDYANSTLILSPTDMPEPDQAGYAAALHNAIVELTTATQGRALVLFTSHSALRAAYEAIRHPLEREQILVLAQGIDGSPKQLLSLLKADQRTVVLGAASFWEGVDVSGEALSLLVMARLPFSVPSDPVFRARSDLFEQPFEQYALPQAILRFKQGFGRLIRRKTDRGVVAVLDRRLLSKRYGESFLRSLPACTLREGPLRDLPAETTAWLGASTEVP